MLNKSNLLVLLEIETDGCGRKCGVRIRVNHPRAAGGITRNCQESLWWFCIADRLLRRFSGNGPLPRYSIWIPRQKDQIDSPQHSPLPVVGWCARKNLPRLSHDEQEAVAAHAFILE